MRAFRIATSSASGPLMACSTSMASSTPRVMGPSLSSDQGGTSPRRVVPTVGFIVTNLSLPSRAVVRFYLRSVRELPSVEEKLALNGFKRGRRVYTRSCVVAKMELLA